MKKYIIFVFLLFIVGYAFLFEPKNVKIENVSIQSPKLSTTTNLKIVQLSDLHLKSLSNYEYRIIRKVNAQQPDIIVITGDFVKNNDIFESPASDDFQQAIQYVQNFLTALKADKGIYVCRGNNDFGNDKEVSNLFLDALDLPGIHMLANKVIPLDDQISILGVDFPDFPEKIAADFGVCNKNNPHFYSKFSKKNSYSHYFKNSNAWMNYTFSGRFRQIDPMLSGIGFTFYSQMSNGYDSFYRLRKSAGSGSFLFSHHDAPQPQGDIYVDTPIEAKKWYRFKIQVLNQIDGNLMRAKIWQARQSEPELWQAQAVDRTRRFSQGTIGLWSAGEATNYFDDLLVVSLTGDTLLNETFTGMQPGSNPSGWVDFNYDLEAIPLLMQQVPDDHFSIFLGHSPDFGKWAADSRVDLFLAGHTHGGQIRLPFVGPVFIKTKVGKEFYQGMHQIENTMMYVNRGIGTAVMPIRFLCPPEITVITLTGTKN